MGVFEVWGGYMLPIRSLPNHRASASDGQSLTDGVKVETNPRTLRRGGVEEVPWLHTERRRLLLHKKRQHNNIVILLLWNQIPSHQSLISWAWARGQSQHGSTWGTLRWNLLSPIPQNHFIFLGPFQVHFWAILRGTGYLKVSSCSSSLITPDIFKQLGSYERPNYPLQNGLWYPDIQQEVT